MGGHKGTFITFEGGEGAGKTTLIERIQQELTGRGIDVLKTFAPGGSQVGQLIRDLLLHKKDLQIEKRCELLLFLADRAQHVEEVIKPALARGTTVLCDRFNDSTVAYQAGGRGLNAEKVSELCHFACGGLQPDLTIYLDVDPQVGFARRKKVALSPDRIESEKNHFHQKIRTAFHEIVRQNPHRVHCIDGSLDPDSVFKQAMALIFSKQS